MLQAPNHITKTRKELVMGCLMFASLVGAAMLIVGWVALPEPKWFRDFWAKLGFADKD